MLILLIMILKKKEPFECSFLLASRNTWNHKD